MSFSIPSASPSAFLLELQKFDLPAGWRVGESSLLGFLKIGPYRFKRIGEGAYAFRKKTYDSPAGMVEAATRAALGRIPGALPALRELRASRIVSVSFGHPSRVHFAVSIEGGGGEVDVAWEGERLRAGRFLYDARSFRKASSVLKAIEERAHEEDPPPLSPFASALSTMLPGWKIRDCFKESPEARIELVPDFSRHFARFALSKPTSHYAREVYSLPNGETEERLHYFGGKRFFFSPFEIVEALRSAAYDL